MPLILGLSVIMVALLVAILPPILGGTRVSGDTSCVELRQMDDEDEDGLHAALIEYGRTEHQLGVVPTQVVDSCEV